MSTKKAQSPLLGYNTNVRHKGHLFHIQTEDSGLQYGHVITHLFTEGTILATKKTSYNDLIETASDLENQVRALMKNQHKTMFIELRDSVHDKTASRIMGHPLEKSPKKNKKSQGPSAPPIPIDAAKTPSANLKEEDTGVQVIIPAGAKKSAEPNNEQVANSSAPDGTEAAKKNTISSQARSIFETPDENGQFGESLISDKSLDEVILGYLTEDDLE